MCMVKLEEKCCRALMKITRMPSAFSQVSKNDTVLYFNANSIFRWYGLTENFGEEEFYTTF